VNDVSNGNWSAVASNAALPTGTWVHVAVTRTNAALKTYVDRILQATYSPALPIMTNGAVLIGRGDYGYFSGAIDEVRIYSRELSGQEIQAIAKY
jgi:hypothetical protein